jgi:hypothetical protein
LRRKRIESHENGMKQQDIQDMEKALQDRKYIFTRIAEAFRGNGVHKATMHKQVCYV